MYYYYLLFVHELFIYPSAHYISLKSLSLSLKSLSLSLKSLRSPHSQLHQYNLQHCPLHFLHNHIILASSIIDCMYFYHGYYYYLLFVYELFIFPCTLKLEIIEIPTLSSTNTSPIFYAVHSTFSIIISFSPALSFIVCIIIIYF